MKQIKVKNTYDINIAGIPDTEVNVIKTPSLFVINPLRVKQFKAKLLVKKQDTVKIGTPYILKKQSHVQFLSPVAGTITDIEYGDRRSIKEIIISKDKDEDSIKLFEPISNIETLSRQDVVNKLLQGGLWATFKQYPFNAIPKAETVPPAIYVTIDYDEPHMPNTDVILNKYSNAFLKGLEVIKQLSDSVYVGKSTKSSVVNEKIQNEITHQISGDYPANESGIFLYYNKKSKEENNSWGIKSLDVIRIGQLFTTGTYPTEKIIVIAGSEVTKPCHIKTREGICLKDLSSYIKTDGPTRIICGGILTGDKVELSDGLGFYDYAVNVIPEGSEQELLTFFRPGFNKPTFSNTYLSATVKKLDWTMTSSINGGYRACISCGSCAKVCPVDSSPQLIMKSLKNNDIETAIQYGLLDTVGPGLY